MKRIIILLVSFFSFINVQAAYLRNIPMTVTQPDGTVLQCFASGDEYFNYLHDANGFTIMRHPKTGYYVYAEKRDGKLVATDYIAGRQDPTSKGLQPYALISPEEWMARRKAWEEPEKQSKSRGDNPNHGTLNNISIFIRFSDDPELTNSYAAIDNMFNDVSEGAVSMRSYFRAASYGAIEIPTTFYPGHNDDVVISYQDTYPRSYFEPYDETSNTNGYPDDSERTEREFSLLERAVNYVNENYPIPTSIDIDYDRDGYVDNVCFIVKGGVGAWNSLLWPHKWALYGKDVYINGKRVWTFNFQLADASSYFNTPTMCHEMNHSLSAPDLYHYSYSGPTPVGIWDLMENDTNPPQHCGAYMKMKYGHWIDEIPEITQAGVYSLKPISSNAPINVAYKIATEDPDQFYVLEYRKNTSLFETGLPGSGLLVYRIDTRFSGNASYDPSNGIYDEVYVFRPGGSISASGDLNFAYFSADAGRTEFSSSTNAYPFYTDGTVDYNFRIYNISEADSEITFSYGTSSECDPPTNLVASVEGNNVTLSWDAANNAQSYNIYRSGTLVGNTSGTTYTDSNVAYGRYNYFLRSVDSGGLVSTISATVTATIVPEGSIFIGDGSSSTNDMLPSYNYYNYTLSQQIYTPAELGDAGVLTSIAFYNGGAEKTRTYDFYIKNTTKSTFSSTSDWETVSAADKVFSGSVTMTANDWTIITLDNPFDYDGFSNIVLVADDNSGSWSGTPHMSCRVFAAQGQAIRVYSDNNNYNPIAPESYSGTEVLNVKNQLLLAKMEPTTDPITITVSANPINGGTVSGGGVFNFGETCTVTATPNQSFRFTGWFENGQLVSNDTEFSFTVVNDRNLVATFGEGILIGDGGTATNTFLPSYTYYNYSLTQQIYTAHEIGNAGVINSIAFYNGGAKKTRTYDFYLVTTQKASFESGSDWIAISDSDKVFSGEISLSSDDWTKIVLDTPFDYDGTSNLLLVADDNSEAWTSAPHMACRVFDAPSQAIRVYSDGTNYSPFSPSSYSGTVLDVKNQLLLDMDIIVPDALLLEPFEEYTVGNQIAAEAIAAGHNWWTTWSNEPGGSEDGLVAYYGGSQCGLISGTTDNVLLLGDIDNGIYDLEFDVLVPEGKNGYFNILHHFDGGNSSWAMQAYLHLTNDGQTSESAPGSGTVHAGSNSTCVLPCVYDEWMHFRTRVNTNNDIAELYFNETLMCSWQWSLDSFGADTVSTTIAAMDFFAPMTDGSSEFYIDNIRVKEVVLNTQTVELSSGWNYFSTNVEITLDDLKAALVDALPGTQIMIKSQTGNCRYTGSTWRAAGLTTLDVTKMYKISVTADCSITLEGDPIDPAEHPITIVANGNTYFGFPIGTSMTIGDAFAGFNPVSGDMVKSQTGNSRYTGSTWRAAGLSTLEPGHGYIFVSKSSENRTLIFPSSTK